MTRFNLRYTRGGETPVSHTHLFGIWVNVPKGRYICFDGQYVGSTFWIKELNLFDLGPCAISGV